jgi:hypothetical protein
VRLNTELAKRCSGRSKASKSRRSNVAVDARSSRWRSRERVLDAGRVARDQRSGGNGKEARALDERARLTGERSP